MSLGGYASQGCALAEGADSRASLPAVDWEGGSSRGFGHAECFASRTRTGCTESFGSRTSSSEVDRGVAEKILGDLASKMECGAVRSGNADFALSI